MTKFEKLVELWKEEKKFTSSMSKIEKSKYYQEIILLGKPAIKLIIEELKREPDYWFAALSILTGENPIPPEDVGNLNKMTSHWLEWAEKNV